MAEFVCDDRFHPILRDFQLVGPRIGQDDLSKVPLHEEVRHPRTRPKKIGGVLERARLNLGGLQLGVAARPDPFN